MPSFAGLDTIEALFTLLAVVIGLMYYVLRLTLRFVTDQLAIERETNKRQFEDQRKTYAQTQEKLIAAFKEVDKEGRQTRSEDLKKVADTLQSLSTLHAQNHTSIIEKVEESGTKQTQKIQEILDMSTSVKDEILTAIANLVGEMKTLTERVNLISQDSQEIPKLNAAVAKLQEQMIELQKQVEKLTQGKENA